MPSRNRIKDYMEDGFYHVYNRGVNKRIIFKDNYDYSVFLNLLKRYLDKEPAQDKQGREYQTYYGKLELLAFCLMPNHYHLLIYQHDATSMTEVLHRVGTSYSAYFNKRHKRSGPLFQDRFKATLISQDNYLQHISRYIHLNPSRYKDWRFSSLPYYLGERSASWICPDRISGMFSSVREYKNFLEDYEDYKQMLEEVKSELANA